MNPWPFVIAAYGVAAILTGGLFVWAFRTMRRAETAAETLIRK